MLSRSIKPTGSRVHTQVLARTFAAAPASSTRPSMRSFHSQRVEAYERSERPRASSSFKKNYYNDDPSTRKNFNRDFAPKLPKWLHNKREQALQSRTETLHLKTLADLSVQELSNLTKRALLLKYVSKRFPNRAIETTLDRKTVALIFNKRSTRTRVASETSTRLLGGHPMFLGGQDIQLGVNETLADTAKVVGSMVDGFMARVGAHEEIEVGTKYGSEIGADNQELAQHSKVPVINALSDLYHPTQILADILTLHEHYEPGFSATLDGIAEGSGDLPVNTLWRELKEYNPLASLAGKKAAWVGDTNNISNELLVVLPRLGMDFAIASPKGYDQVDPRVWAEVEKAGTTNKVKLTNSPAEALKGADVVITDTWISMGQEEEKAARLKAFEGYQITNEMVESAGAKPDWIFMHCLPRKQEEVNDDVFYGERSVVFPEAENRKWTIMAVFDAFIGRRQV